MYHSRCSLERGPEARMKARGPSACLQEAGSIAVDREGGKIRRNKEIRSQEDCARGGERKSCWAAGGHGGCYLQTSIYSPQWETLGLPAAPLNPNKPQQEGKPSTPFAYSMSGCLSAGSVLRAGGVKKETEMKRALRELTDL